MTYLCDILNIKYNVNGCLRYYNATTITLINKVSLSFYTDNYVWKY